MQRPTDTETLRWYQSADNGTLPQYLCCHLKRLNHNRLKMQFPDIDELLFNLEEKIDEQIGIVENYFLEREDTLNLISQNWLEHDYVSEIMADLKTNGQVLEGVSQLDLYRLCETGKKRYKKSTPPGFMDNDKDGIRKYGDFIWWNQIIQYAKKQKKNVILVTDDMKRDWW